MFKVPQQGTAPSKQLLFELEVLFHKSQSVRWILELLRRRHWVAVLLELSSSYFRKTLLVFARP
jgi:hypothetical protein